MNLVMAGMIPTMVILAAAWPQSESPLAPEFWFRMSLATIAGGILAYPINYYLVARHLKHGCMTLPGVDTPAEGLGHTSPEAASGHDGMTMHSHHQGHAGDAADIASSATGPMAHHHGTAHSHQYTHEAKGETHAAGDMSGSAGGGHQDHAMAMNTLSWPVATLIIAATFAVLFGAIALTARFVPIHF